MKRYEEIVLEAGKDIIFKVSEGTNGKLIISAPNINTYSTNYINPPIPKRYKHVCGEWNNGFVIERCSDGSQFVWIPVGSLDFNGSLDGEHFVEKFGGRSYAVRGGRFNEYEYDYNGSLKGELLEQLESVKKYGGFYISRYNISKSSAGKPQSVRGVMPWVFTNFYDAKKIASTIEDSETVKSHLTFEAEYDSVLEWVIETKVKTLAEIERDSTGWGNYSNTGDYYQAELFETGSREEWCVNNIFDLAGNTNEWTQSHKESLDGVIRGAHYAVANRFYYGPCWGSTITGFRVALYIK